MSTLAHVQAVIRGCQTRKKISLKKKSAKIIQRVFRARNKSAFALRKRLHCVIQKLVPGQSVMCPILMKLIHNPVLNFCDGKVYERWALEGWANVNNTCPTTRKPLQFIGLNKIIKLVHAMGYKLKEAYKQIEYYSKLTNKIQGLHQREVDMLEKIISNQKQENKLLLKNLVENQSDELFRLKGFGLMRECFRCSKNGSRLMCGKCMKYKTSAKWSDQKKMQALFQHLFNVHNIDFGFLFQKYHYSGAQVLSVAKANL